MISSVASLYYSAGPSLYSKFPSVVWIIFVLEFLQSLILSGIEATLFTIFEHFHLQNRLTILILHSSLFIRGIFFVTGGWLADSYFGKFNVYCTSLLLLCLVINPLCCINFVNVLTLDGQKIVFIVTLYTFSMLLGGLSCKMPLYSEQFLLPLRERELRTFTIVMFWIQNVSYLIGGLTVPLFVKHYSCFDMDCCISWALIAGAGLNVLQLLILVICRRSFFERNLFTHQIVEKTIDVILFSLSRRLGRKSRHPEVNHFLDYGEEKYERFIVNGAKRLLSLMLLFLSFFSFWTARAQLKVMWTIQSMYLDSTTYSKFFAPQQVGLLNTFFNLILIPSVYTLFTRRWHNYLYWIGIGFTCMCVSAIISVILQDQIERARIPEPFDVAHLRIYNTLSQKVTVDCKFTGKITLAPFQMKENLHLHVRKPGKTLIKLQINEEEWNDTIQATKEESVSYLIRNKQITRVKGFDPIRYHYHMRPTVYFMCGLVNCSDQNIKPFSYLYREKKKTFSSNDERIIYVLKQAGKYQIQLNDREAIEMEFRNGGVYSGVIVSEPGIGNTVKMYQVMTENTISITWIVPQFLLSSLADTFTWISLDMFVYTQSPTCLRAFTRSLYLVSQTFGSAMLASSFVSPGFYFRDYMILYCVVSGSFLLLFLYLAVKYKPKKPSDKF